MTTTMRVIIISTLMLCFSNRAKCQTFKAVQINPFGINLANPELNDMQFADLTNDGAFDIIFNSMDDGPFIVINKGVSGEPDFSNSPALSFISFDENQVGQGTFTDPTSSFFDGDGDGDLDHLFFIGSDNLTLNPEYILELNTPELVPDNYKFYFGDQFLGGAQLGLPYQPFYTLETHVLGDLNGDGKIDILANRLNEENNEHSFVYYENIASNGELLCNNIALENPFGLAPDSNGEMTFGFLGLFDPDGDGDLDLLLSNFSGEWLYYENIGNMTAPLFTSPITNPFGLTPLPTFGIVHLMDVNGDGKTDIICGSGTNVYYFEFDKPSENKEYSKSNDLISVSPNPASSYIDILDQGFDAARFILYDFYGNQILQNKLNSNINNRIQLNNIANGNYFIEIIGKDGTSSSIKLIKQ